MSSTEHFEKPNNMSTVKTFRYRNQTWYWNGFWGFFFQAISAMRKRERIVKEGHPLYADLKVAAGYP